MKKILFMIFLGAFLLTGCAGPRVISKAPRAAGQKPAQPNSRALNFYLSGALYDFQDQYEKALLDYYQALLYDSTSAQILKAIGRDLMRTNRYESATQYLKRSYKFNPRDKETIYYLAEANFNTKNYQMATRYFEKFLELDPDNATVQNNLIYLYTQQHQDEKLIKMRERLWERSGYDFDQAVQLITLYIKNKRMDRAQAMVEKLLTAQPNNAENWVLQGMIHEMQKDTVSAVSDYKKAAQIEPGNAQAQGKLYEFFRKRQDWDGLTRVFSQIVAADSLDYRARLILSEGLFYSKKYQQAADVVVPLQDSPDFRLQAYEMLGRVATIRKEFDKAEDYYNKLIDGNPQNKFAWIFLANLYFQENKPQKSLKVMQKAIDIIPGDPDLLSNYGVLLNQMKRYKEALPVLKQAHQLDPEDLNTIVSLSALYEQLKMYNAADSLYQYALKKYPDEAILLNNYSYSLSERGIKLNEALKMALRALNKNPDNGAYLDTVGWIYYQLGDFKTALTYIKKAVDNREDSPVVIEHLGDIYSKLGNFSKAREYWQKAYEMDSSNMTLKEKLGQE